MRLTETVITSENFIPEITPRLRRMLDVLHQPREVNEIEQKRRKKTNDQHRRLSRDYNAEDLVLVQDHTFSNAEQGITATLTPHRDVCDLSLSRAYHFRDSAR